jgi:serine/threonine protein kinase
MGNAATCQNLCSKRNPKGDQKGEIVSRKDFKDHYAIGRGGFGKVILVEKDGKFYAMKEMLKARVMAKKSVESVKKELELM